MDFEGYEGGDKVCSSFNFFFEILVKGFVIFVWCGVIMGGGGFIFF